MLVEVGASIASIMEPRLCIQLLEHTVGMKRTSRKWLVENGELTVNSFGKLWTDFVGVLHEDDSIYFDPARDSDFTQYMKDLCRAEEETEELFPREGCGR